MEDLIRIFEENEVEYVVVGGFAVHRLPLYWLLGVSSRAMRRRFSLEEEDGERN
jgi:hypothetical protein